MADEPKLTPDEQASLLALTGAKTAESLRKFGASGKDVKPDELQQIAQVSMTSSLAAIALALTNKEER